MIRFDATGRIQELRVFTGNGHFDDAYLMERWSFSDWRKQSSGDFPTIIAADFFAIPPVGVNSPFKTARRRHLRLSLVNFSNTDLSDQVFNFQKPGGALAQIQDDRYDTPVVYTYQGAGTIDELSERYHQYPQGSAPVSLANRAITPLLLLVGVGALWRLRSQLRSRT